MATKMSVFTLRNQTLLKFDTHLEFWLHDKCINTLSRKMRTQQISSTIGFLVPHTRMAAGQISLHKLLITSKQNISEIFNIIKSHSSAVPTIFVFKRGQLTDWFF